MRTKASVLVGLLWCLALLSIVVLGALHTARIDLWVVKNHGDRMQAHYLALAGIEKAKALLYQDAKQRSRSASNHTGELYDAPQQFRAVRFGRGQFQVFRQGLENEGGRVVYGVSDEESRLNVNYASSEELAKLDEMTPDVVAAILDWRDEDNEVTPGGAEVEYYAALKPPYQPRNGPLQTVRELLMVRGISHSLLLGKGADQETLLTPDEAEASDAVASDADVGLFEAGWAPFLTVDSTVQNVNAAGEDRVDIQSADENSLTQVKGISADIAKAIVAYRGQNRLQSVADLLDVRAAQTQNQTPLQASPGPAQSAPGQPPSDGNPPTQNPSAPNLTGPKMVSETLLLDIADDLTAQSDRTLPGVVNINTASLDVLACLPGLNRDLAQAIISYRQSNGFYPNVAWLLRVPGMNQQLFKQVAPRVTARSETFRILSEGKVTSSGTRQRIQAIVHVGLRAINTLSYREDDL
jgi:competence ComEA-like helix-hairpin-helix protein